MVFTCQMLIVTDLSEACMSEMAFIGWFVNVSEHLIGTGSMLMGHRWICGCSHVLRAVTVWCSG